MLSIPRFLTNQHKTGYLTNFWYADFKFLTKKILSLIVYFWRIFKNNHFFAFFGNLTSECNIFPMLSIPQFLTNSHKTGYITNSWYLNLKFLSRKILSSIVFLANLLKKSLFRIFRGFDSRMQNDISFIFLELFSWIQYSFAKIVFFILKHMNNIVQLKPFQLICNMVL